MDIQRDISNWQTSITRTSYGIDWKKFLPADITEADVRNDVVLRQYLEEHFYRNGKVAAFIKWIRTTTSAQQIRVDLEGLLGHPVLEDSITIFITTFHRAPYDVQQHLFFLIFREQNRERSITTIYHELMHFLFHQYYWKQCQDAGLDEQQIHRMKEAATVLLNPILKERGLPLDMGYPQHEELRAFMQRVWQKHRHFSSFLTEVLANAGASVRT